MSNAAKAQQEPTMEEILASIRRIIADDTQAAEAAPAKKAKAEPKPEPAAAPVPEPEAGEGDDGLNQDDIDAVFASMGENNGETADATVEDADEPGDVLELTDEMSDWNAALEESKTETPEDDANEPEPRVETPALVEPTEVVFTEAEEPEEAVIEPEPEPESQPEPVSMPGPQARTARPAASVDEMADSLLSPMVGAAVSSAFGSLSRTLINQNPRTLEDLVADMLRPMLKDWLEQNLPTVVERMVRSEIERLSRGRG